MFNKIVYGLSSGLQLEEGSIIPKRSRLYCSNLANQLRLGILLILFIVQTGGISYGQTISRKQALIMAEQTREAEAFYNLNQKAFINCIEKSVKKSCDSDWVTCIDDGWVVQFVVGEKCFLQHDGRLQLTFVIDKNGNIISRFPEADYLLDKQYCLENYDCMCHRNVNIENQCLNFIYGQILKTDHENCYECKCVNHICMHEMRKN